MPFASIFQQFVYLGKAHGIKILQEFRKNSVRKKSNEMIAIINQMRVNDTDFGYLLPCPFTGPKIICAGPNVLSQPKNLTAFSASHKDFVPDTKMICIQ